MQGQFNYSITAGGKMVIFFSNCFYFLSEIRYQLRERRLEQVLGFEEKLRNSYPRDSESKFSKGI